MLIDAKHVLATSPGGTGTKKKGSKSARTSRKKRGGGAVGTYSGNPEGTG